MNKHSSFNLAIKIWLLTALLTACALHLIMQEQLFVLFILFAVSLFGSVPALVGLWIVIPMIKKTTGSFETKLLTLLFAEAIIVVPYGIIGGVSGIASNDEIQSGLLIFGAIIACNIVATLSFHRHLQIFFGNDATYSFQFQNSQNKNKMETMPGQAVPQSNTALIKGLITGGLILFMLIPTFLVKNLVSEREQRHKEVVEEVSSKWSGAQTVSGPFLVIPYNEPAVDAQGKPVFVKKQVILISKNMHVKGEIFPENRPRSIYKVLLYRSNIDITGSFQPVWPADLQMNTLELNKAVLCFGLNDFKGIEQEVSIDFNKSVHAFAPGLPENWISRTGLSVPVTLTVEDLQAGIPYNMNVKLKGSETLHFMPLSANSSFALKSKWPDPSFDGNSLPGIKDVTKDGFTASWNYNQANLPFGMVIRNAVPTEDLSFGVSLVQPADQYNKTMRSIKYAILIIGLTFALFFIVELMQGKPFHPVQYVLIGLALVIFYTLLLSISEYMLFDHAYMIAAIATVLLISLYAKSHFKSWKIASVFGTSLLTLYGFIFVLLRLEDTALLVGSIGLFIVLAIVMYISRKIDWYTGKGLKPVTVTENTTI